MKISVDISDADFRDMLIESVKKQINIAVRAETSTYNIENMSRKLVRDELANITPGIVTELLSDDDVKLRMHRAVRLRINKTIKELVE